MGKMYEVAEYVAIVNAESENDALKGLMTAEYIDSRTISRHRKLGTAKESFNKYERSMEQMADNTWVFRWYEIEGYISNNGRIISHAVIESNNFPMWD